MRMIPAAVAILAVAMSPAPAAAEVTYPWCAQYGDPDGMRNCGFWTWEQCRAAISGNGGYCLENPMYLGVLPGTPRRPRR
jgi:hypothetical protein